MSAMQQLRQHVVDENVQNDAMMAVEEQTVSYRKVEELEMFGINKADIMKLKAGGFNTIESIAHATLRKLQDVKGISEQKAQKLKDIIKSNGLVSMGFTTATVRLEIAKDVIFISTGSRDLDALLNGGIETGSLTEVFGEFRTGTSPYVIILTVRLDPTFIIKLLWNYI